MISVKSILPSENTNPANSASIVTEIENNSSNINSVKSTTSSEGSMESTDSSSSCEQESTVGHYKIIRTIKETQNGKVKLAKHIPSDKDVAIKIIHKRTLNANSVRKLANEIKIMRTLQHSNIVKLLDVIETEASHYLVMEYFSGGDLFDYIADRDKLNENEARQIFRQIVTAIDYCHQNRIIHRDVKAENILLDSRTNIKLADFGFSNQLTPENKLSTPCGTPAYVAPEIFLGKKYGVEVDIWSLGIILYVLVTGRYPFNGPTMQHIRKKVLLCNYNIPDYVSKDCKSLIEKILVYCPSKRASLRAIMDDEWINKGYENDRLKPYEEQLKDLFISKTVDP